MNRMERIKVEKIKQYWDERAEQFSSSPEATTDDVYLRELEIATIIQTLREIGIRSGKRILDAGCGNGYSTIRVAEQFAGVNFIGLDYSEKMIESAQAQLKQRSDLEKRLVFKVGDVTALSRACGEGLFDAILSDRCLINLESADIQKHAIAQIAMHLTPGGYYVAVENFIEGHKNMNEARRSVGLPEIPIRWHNLYFEEQGFLRMTESFFENVIFNDFSSSYYFATRVIYSAMCQMRGEPIDYKHEIHQLAVRLPRTGQFSPIRMAVMRKRLN